MLRHHQEDVRVARNTYGPTSQTMDISGRITIVSANKTRAKTEKTIQEKQ